MCSTWASGSLRIASTHKTPEAVFIFPHITPTCRISHAWNTQESLGSVEISTRFSVRAANKVTGNMIRLAELHNPASYLNPPPLHTSLTEIDRCLVNPRQWADLFDLRVSKHVCHLGIGGIFKCQGAQKKQQFWIKPPSLEARWQIQDPIIIGGL